METTTPDDVSQAFGLAPFAPEGWDTALRGLARITGSSHGQLIAFGVPDAISLNHITDADPLIFNQLGEVGGADPKRSWRVAASGRPMEIIHEEHYEAVRPALDSAAYDALCERIDMVHGCQTVLVARERMFVGMAVLRKRREGWTNARQRARFEHAAIAAQNAVLLQIALQAEGAKLAMGALSAMNSAAFLCDAAGRVNAWTQAGEAVLENGQIGLCKDRLYAPGATGPPDLAQAIARAITGDGAPRTRSSLWLASGNDPLAGCWCEVFPLPRHEWNFDFAPSAVVVVHRPEAIDVLRGRAIAETIGLTPSEAGIALALAEGDAREAIAARRGVSLATVTSQIKAVFAKAGVTREAELVALINRLARG